MNNVVSLSGLPTEASEACADKLREALQIAKAGDMRAVAVVYVAKGHEVVTGYEAGTAYTTLLGGSALLQHDLLHSGDVPGIDN